MRGSLSNEEVDCRPIMTATWTFYGKKKEKENKNRKTASLEKRVIYSKCVQN